MPLVAFLGLGVVGSLSACTAPVDGLIGITLDTSGQPDVVLMSCQHHLGGVTLYWPDHPAGSDSNHAVVAQWKLPVAYSSPIRWPLLSPKPEGLTITKEPSALTPGRTYRIYGWTHESPYYSADGPEFKAQDLAQLRPGEVLMEDLQTNMETTAPARVTMAQFKQLACQ
jgi:hypothetical protein